MNFIEELYYGNIQPNQKIYNKNSQYAEDMKRFCHCEDKLNELLKGEELDIFNNLIDTHDEITATVSLENFKLGFRLGVQMICDSLIFNKDQIFMDIFD